MVRKKRVKVTPPITIDIAQLVANANKGKDKHQSTSDNSKSLCNDMAKIHKDKQGKHVTTTQADHDKTSATSNMPIQITLPPLLAL
ncbi:alpha/beta hydrolase [Sesbania bispinosa]|nr:alpha/beta hydrolase [Sesbania bispinosa]